jgi:hypothetical protein
MHVFHKQELLAEGQQQEAASSCVATRLHASAHLAGEV